MKRIIAIAVAGITLAGCYDTTKPEPRPAVVQPSRSTDDMLAEQVWLYELTPLDRRQICDDFWITSDADIYAFLTSPPDALTPSQAEAMIDLMWERC